MDMPLASPAVRNGSFDKLLMKVAGVDEETLCLCPAHDWDNVRAIGEIMLCTWLYQAALFSVVGHRLFAVPGQFRPEIVAVSGFIATFVLLIDAYMVNRSGWHLNGIEQLKRGGVDLSGGVWARLKAGIFLTIRIALSIALAQLTAVFVSMLIFASDIDARIQTTWRQANAHLFVGATEPVDAEIQRATEAVTAQTARTDALAQQIEALRQNEVDPSSATTQPAQQEVAQLLAQKDKADEELREAEAFAANELAGIKGAPGNSGQVGNGPKRRAAMEHVVNARTRVQEVGRSLDAARARLDALRNQHSAGDEALRQQAHDQLPNFEKMLSAENATLAALKQELSRLTQGRGDAIRAAIDKAPNHVEPDNGLLAQIAVLERIAQSDKHIAVIIILIDVISFGFELAGVLAKVTAYVPTTYAALLARDAYVRVVHIVDAMMDKLAKPLVSDSVPPAIDAVGGGEARDAAQKRAPVVNPFNGVDLGASQPAKRPRGRPRKLRVDPETPKHPIGQTVRSAP